MATSLILFKGLALPVFLFFIKFKNFFMSYVTNSVDVTSL